jgi:hypothetical protein
MKKYISIILFTLIVAGSSCKKNFLSLEDNPNTPSVASPELLLAGSLRTTAALTNSNAYVMYAAWVGYLSYSTGFQVNTALEQYIITTGSYDVWTNYYLNIANYAALGAAGGGPNYAAISKIMTAFDYQALVDNYNNVPYSQATKGTTNLVPTYDSGSAIYDDLMKQLDAAIVLINTAPAGSIVPGAGDIMFKGNMQNWVKFANTLKLRLAIRQTNVTAKASALTAAVAATSALGYLGNATNTLGAAVNPGYLNADANGGQQAPIFLSYGTSAAGTALGSNTTYQANAFGAKFYAVNNDPRLVQVYSPTTTVNAGTATAVQNGELYTQGTKTIAASPFGESTPPNGIIAPSTARSNISPSKFGPGVLKSPTQDGIIMSNAEALFLQSEGVVRGYITGDAAALYNAGITASFVDDLVPTAATAAATYYAQPSVAFPAAGSLDAKVQAIITQKWAALNLYGAAEAWHEQVRTGYPGAPVSIYPGALGGGKQVSRILYPTVEYSTNADNVAAQGTIDVFNSKIFWAK